MSKKNSTKSLFDTIEVDQKNEEPIEAEATLQPVEVEEPVVKEEIEPAVVEEPEAPEAPIVEEADTPATDCVVAVESLRVRSQASTDAETLFLLRKNEHVTVTGKEVNGFVPIEYKGTVGFCMKQFLKF